MSENTDYMNGPKACRNCKWCQPAQEHVEDAEDAYRQARCVRPSDLSAPGGFFCSASRQYGSCGTNATFFQQARSPR